ncbi:hypothetical protein E2C01_001278 [Portunus trituberculatus]|uniref:Uncharacterized protein n=1 Tax=Portunus trituberculatus TaxID=210409 RepID=A0A5B7CHE7_PORTR|nr:hypothetical protein [Portunus trituberculatus]
MVTPTLGLESDLGKGHKCPQLATPAHTHPTLLNSRSMHYAQQYHFEAPCSGNNCHTGTCIILTPWLTQCISFVIICGNTVAITSSAVEQ